MVKQKQFLTVTIFFVVVVLFLSIQASAQYRPQIVRTITYNVIKEFQDGDVYDTKMSADGSKLIFADYATKIYTINTDGTGQRVIFDFERRVDNWLDISAGGSKVVWGNRGGFYVANSDGSQQVLVNKLPNLSGSANLG